MSGWGCGTGSCEADRKFPQIKKKSVIPQLPASRDFSPVQVRHDSFADVATSLLKNPHDFSRSGRVPAGMDDDGAAELGLSVSRGPQHLRLTLCDGPAGADLSDHTAADVCAVAAVKHLADDDVCEL